MEINDKVQELQEELIASIIELVNVPSIKAASEDSCPFGKDISKALDKALDISERLGFKTKNIDGYMGYAEYGQGEEYVGIVGHLDVVPIGTGWTHAPFGGEIKDGRIFGRGVLDNKGPILCALYGLKALKELNINLSKKVRIIFGTDEESGFGDIPHYLSLEKPPIMGFTPDCKYPAVYGERGILKLSISKKLSKKSCRNLELDYVKGEFKTNMVPSYCEIGFKTNNYIGTKELPDVEGIEVITKQNSLIIKSTGKVAAGNSPDLGTNAIMTAACYANKLEIEDDTKEFLSFLDNSVGEDVFGNKLGINYEDKHSGKLLMNVYAIRKEVDKISIDISIRYPITCKFQYLMDKIQEKLSEDMSIEVIKNFNPVCFPQNHVMLKKLQKVYEDITGLDGTPVTTSGGTYAKVMPNIVAFGPSFPGQKGIGHNADEYMDIGDIIKNAKIYANAIYELAK